MKAALFPLIIGTLTPSHFGGGIAHGLSVTKKGKKGKTSLPSSLPILVPSDVPFSSPEEENMAPVATPPPPPPPVFKSAAPLYNQYDVSKRDYLHGEKSIYVSLLRSVE